MHEEDNPDHDKTAMALKYPDYHTWRNLKDAIARGGYWENYQPVLITDPELQPYCHDLIEKCLLYNEQPIEYLKKLLLTPQQKI